MAMPEDSRYDPAYHNKDPWTDARVRKAMAISIDRQAICNSIYSGGANPIGVPLFAAGTSKYQYPFDQATARQLLKDAGYPNGFSFRFISSVNPGMPETPRVVEAIAAYWQQIGLDPKITMVDYNAYSAQRREFKTAGDVALFKFVTAADMFDKSIMIMTPDCPVPLFQEEASYTIWKEGSATVDANQRSALVDKLNQYFYDNYGPIPIIKIGGVWAWNAAKVSQFAHPAASIPYYLEYVRHAQPLNTFRLFTPFPGR
jgi:peptide/nickel transport system substrate-binding protein